MNDKQGALDYLNQHRILHLATVGKDGGASTRAMFVAQIDPDLTLWFGTGADSNKIAEISVNPAVAVSSFEQGKNFRAFGIARVVNDADVKAKIWEDQWLSYFPKGPTDPNFALVQVRLTKTEFIEMGKM